VPVTNLEKTVSYFDTIYPLHLADMPIDCPAYMADHVKVSDTGRTSSILPSSSSPRWTISAWR
jgi:hypothetical protein